MDGGRRAGGRSTCRRRPSLTVATRSARTSPTSPSISAATRRQRRRGGSRRPQLESLRRGLDIHRDRRRGGTASRSSCSNSDPGLAPAGRAASRARDESDSDRLSRWRRRLAAVARLATSVVALGKVRARNGRARRRSLSDGRSDPTARRHQTQRRRWKAACSRSATIRASGSLS